MSSNKKQKLDFKDALKAKGARPPSEAVMVNLHGHPTPVLRLNMSDAEWAPFKARALTEEELQTYEETGRMPKEKAAAAAPSEKDLQFQEETGSERKPSGKMTTVPDDGAGGPRADASMDDSQRTEHVEGALDMGMAVSARNPAGIIPQLATGATPQDVSKAPTDLVPADMGITPADAMAAAHTPDSVAPASTTSPPLAQASAESAKPGPKTGLGELKVEPATAAEASAAAASSARASTDAKIAELEGADRIARKQAEIEQALAHDHAVKQSQLDFDELTRQKVERDTKEKRMQDLVTVQQRLVDLSNQSVDPNRYWASKDTGQKAAAIIAGALFGFTGQGMQWLQRLDGLVAQDIQLQASELARKQGVLKQAEGATVNLIQIAKEQGLEGRQAYLAASAALKNQLAESVSRMMTPYMSDQQKLALQEKEAAIRASGDKDVAKFMVEAEHEAAKNKLDTATLQEKEANARKTNAEAEKARAEAAAGGKKGGKGGDINESTATALGNSIASLRQATGLSTEFKDKASGFMSRVWNALDPAQISDAGKYNAKRFLAIQMIGRALEGGVLKEPEFERYTKMIPVPGQWGGENDWDNLVSQLKNHVQSQVDVLEATGHPVKGLKELLAKLDAELAAGDVNAAARPGTAK